MINSKSSLIVVLFSLIASMAQAQAPAPAASKMYGEISLATNYVEKGLTQSNKSPSVDAGLGYWFGPQGRIGLEAASVSFKNESATVEMRLLGEYKFIFTPNADLRVRNDFYRYFSEGKRNKVLVTLDQNLFGYHVLYSYEDNFEGTKSPRNWFAFHHDIPYGSTFQINITAGYSMVSGFNNFFDTRVGFSYVTPSFSAGVFNTYVSSASQFGGSADMAFLLALQAKF